MVNSRTVLASKNMEQSIIYQLLLWTEFAAAILVFILLFFISAPYGRFNRSGWGPSIKARTAWIIMELPAVFVMILIFLWSAQPVCSLSFAFLVLWEIHYIYRTFAYPLRMRGVAKSFPSLLVAMAFLFNLMNGYINGYALFFNKSPPSVLFPGMLDLRFIIGIVIFFMGMVIHIQSDELLRSLRNKSTGGYHIPRGKLFKYVSCPNYLGEIIEWFGWALLTWSWAGLAFAFFTLANLAPRALAHHRWYRMHFTDYPPKRKALIPFLF